MANYIDFNNQNEVKGYLADLYKRKQDAKDAAETNRITTEITRVSNRVQNNANTDTGSAIAAAKNRFTLSPFKAKMQPLISTQDAYSQAQKELAPAYDAARTNVGINTQQQQALLAQQLNARGQTSGGLANQGAVNLTGGMQTALAGIDTDYATNQATRAAALQDTDYNRKQQDYQNALNAYSTEQGLNLQTQQLNYGAEQDAIDRAYQTARDAIADEQWKNQFDENVRQFGLNYAMQELENNRSYQVNLGQLAVARGQLGVSQQNANLSREQFEYGKEQDLASANTIDPEANYNEVLNDFSANYSAKEALDILSDPDKAQEVRAYIGDENYYKLLKLYQNINGGSVSEYASQIER